MHLRRVTRDRFGRLGVALLGVLTLCLGLMLSLGITFALVGCAPVVPAPSAVAPPGTASSPRPAPAGSAAPTPAPTTIPAPTPAISVPVVDAAVGNQPPAVAPPSRIQVPALGIDMAVEPVGVEPDGAMSLPPDTDIAGWYRFGSAPVDAAGASVIAAHVDSMTYGIGPFSRLVDAPAGTEIVVTTADGVQHRYAVEAVQLTLKSEMPWAAIFDRAGAPRLTLVTCGGEYDYSGAGRYLSNVVLSAVAL